MYFFLYNFEVLLLKINKKTYLNYFQVKNTLKKIFYTTISDLRPLVQLHSRTQ